MAYQLTDCLIKIVGVFAYEHKKDIPRFTLNNYAGMQLVDLPEKIKEQGVQAIKKAVQATEANYKNTYYSEFRDFMFTGNEQSQTEGYQKSQIRTFQRMKTLTGNFDHKRFDEASQQMVDAPISFTSEKQELFLFPGGIGMFALNLKPLELTLNGISDLINKARTFESKVINEDNLIDFHKWISKEVLCGTPLVGDKLELDEFSGSKFKVYTVIDMPEPSETTQYNRDHILYEIGTSSPIGIVGASHKLSPSDEYYKDIMLNKISAFRNYECLALLDSFTVIGNDNFSSISDSSEKYIPHHQWNRVYFGIYLYNLFIRYSLFKFNAKFLTDPVKYRDDFQNFLNHYNFKHISFNFLPNLIFDKIRNALRIEDEIITFEKRLGSLAASIQEQQEKRQAFLLTLISVVSTFEAIDTIANWLNQTQAKSGINKPLFYALLGFITLILAYLLVLYLFPLLSQKINRKLKKIIQTKKKV
jgi:hypothetical protein